MCRVLLALQTGSDHFPTTVADDETTSDPAGGCTKVITLLSSASLCEVSMHRCCTAHS
jgi:hypothetical protein